MSNELPEKCTRGYWELWAKLLHTFRRAEQAHADWQKLKVWRSPEGKLYSEEAALNILKARAGTRRSVTPKEPAK